MLKKIWEVKNDMDGTTHFMRISSHVKMSCLKLPSLTKTSVQHSLSLLFFFLPMILSYFNYQSLPLHMKHNIHVNVSQWPSPVDRIFLYYIPRTLMCFAFRNIDLTLIVKANETHPQVFRWEHLFLTKFDPNPHT